MQQKRIAPLILIMALIMLVAACERPASKAPVSTPIDGDIIRTPLPVDQQILNATMTAQAILEKYDQPTVEIKTKEPVEETTEEAIDQPTEMATTSEATTEPTAVQTPTQLPPTPVFTKPTEYTVHEGEFAYCLARRFDVNPNDLLSVNGLNEYSYFSEGMVLTIPTTGSFPGERALMAHPDTWTVSAGETIYDIACAYGDLYPEAIVVVNGLQEPYTLTAGQILQIP